MTLRTTSQIPLELLHRIPPFEGVVVHPYGALLLRLALLGLRREAHQQPLFRQLLVAVSPHSQLQHRISLQTTDNVLVEHHVLHPADGRDPFAAILRGTAAMKNHLIRGGVVNEDVAVVIDAARRSQYDVNIRVFALEIGKLGLVQSVVQIVAENGDLHPCRN